MIPGERVTIVIQRSLLREPFATPGFYAMTERYANSASEDETSEVGASDEWAYAPELGEAIRRLFEKMKWGQS